MVSASKQPAARVSQPSPRFIKVAGDPREMGVQQGKALAADVRATMDVLLSSDAFELLRPRLVPRWLFKHMAVRQGARLLSEPVLRERPEMHARARGIAEGAGLPFSSVWLMHAAEILLAAADWQRRPPPLAACSTLAVRGARAKDGTAIHHAFDYPDFTRPYFVVRESRPAKGHASLDFTVAPLAGTVDGINDAGLAITTNYAFTTDLPKAPVPNTLALAAALARCATTAEAVDFLSTHARGEGGLLMIADASGDIVSLEISGARAEVRRPGKGEDSILHTNVLSTPPLREVEIPRDAVYTKNNIAAVRGLSVHESSEVRMETLARRLAARKGPIGKAELLDIFTDHGQTPGGDDNSLCRHGPYWVTAATLQLLPRERRLRAVFDSPCRSVPVDFTL